MGISHTTGEETVRTRNLVGVPDERGASTAANRSPSTGWAGPTSVATGDARRAGAMP